MRSLSVPKSWITISQQHSDVLSVVGAAVTVVLWASAFAGIRAGLRSYSPESVALLRYLTASILMLGIATLKGLPIPEWVMFRASRRWDFWDLVSTTWP